MTPSPDSRPLVSCIMPTCNRRAYAQQAIRYFQRQDYENRELIIIDDGADGIGDMAKADERIRYIRLDKKATIGAKRNWACEQAHGELIMHWDDDDWIINNPNVHSLSGENIKNIFTKDILSGFGLNSNYYRPLLLISFAFNWVMHGSGPVGYHLISNLFHIGNAILIFILLSTCTTRRVVHGETVDNFGKRAAFIASLLWLVHPLNVEAVAYISGRGDPMSVFFILLALWLYVKNKKWWAAVLFILAILSRETAILFPALLMIFYVSFASKLKFWPAFKDALKKSLPYWAISVFYFVLRLTILNFRDTLNFYNESNLYTEHLSYRLYTFGQVLVEYLKLIFVPLGLHMERNVLVNTSLTQWPVWLGFLLIALMVYLAVKSFKKNRIWFFAFAWFFVAISPVSGIIPVNAIMYEHWLYLPLIGLFALAGWYADVLLTKVRSRVFIYRLAIILLVLYLGFFSIASAKRNLAWGNPTKFYEDILRYNPNTVRIITNLGNIYSANQEYEKAADMYKRAISVDGETFAQPYYNLGNVYNAQGKPQEAEKMYIKAIQVDPSFHFAYRNLAILYARYGFFQQAIDVLKAFKQIRPDDPAIDEAIRRLQEDMRGN